MPKLKNCTRCEVEPCFSETASGKCLLLSDTNFKNYPCPFYKTVEEFEAGLKKYGGLILEKGGLKK